MSAAYWTSHLRGPVLLLGLLVAVPATTSHADVWSAQADYSTTANPSGVWSYGRKWTPTSASMDLMTVQWGSSGWYMGNFGHGGPSIQGYVNLWAKNNSNGLPVVRWTAPRDDLYYLDTTFTGNDSRGVDVYAYVVVNDSSVFSQRILGNGSTAHHAAAELALRSGDTIDFVIEWGGSVYHETSWTLLSTLVTDFPMPTSIGSPCATPYLTWSGSPTLGDTYTVTTQALGTSTQYLLVDWSTLRGRAAFFRLDGCRTSLLADSVVFLGNSPSYSFSIPNNMGLVGARLRTQAAIAGPTVTTTQAIDALISE